MATLNAALRAMIGFVHPGEHVRPSSIFLRLRAQALELTAADLRAPEDAPVLAVLAETAHERAIATLVAVIDGSASLYFSNGGAIIGAGQHPGPHAAALQLVHLAGSMLDALPLTEVFPLPARQTMAFYVITPNGVRTGRALAPDAAGEANALEPLARAAQSVISQIRQIDQSRTRVAG